jgi:hypothetical protein
MRTPFGEPARVDVWRIEADGSNATNLTTDSPANDALPHVSADGRRIVFRSDRDGGRQIYVMDGDGRNVRRLSDAGGVETMPALSPDGEWVVFSTDRAGGMQLYLQRVDGAEGRFLEPDRAGLPELNMHPRFSPDGEWVVFTSSRAGFNDEWPLTLFPQPYGELWAVPVAGGEAVRLTHDKWEDGPSDWGFVRLPPYEPVTVQAEAALPTEAVIAIRPPGAARLEPAPDPELAATAATMARRSARVRPGEPVWITGGSDDVPFMEHLAVAVGAEGGHPVVTVSSDEMLRGGQLPFYFFFTLPGATVHVDDRVVVADGQLPATDP